MNANHVIEPSVRHATGNNHILLVEDEPANAVILSSYLQYGGFIVDEVTDGLEAWNRLQENPDTYRLVVTDKRMPNMNGLELAARMKADRRFSKIPVIIQTGDASHDEFLKGIKAGVYYYLAKPYDEAAIIALVRSAIAEQDKKDIFERRLNCQQNAIGNLVKGEFFLRTPDEAQSTALLLGSIFPKPELAAAGLFELLLNGIEHGNLGIGFREKSDLLKENRWQDEVEKRLIDPAYEDKRVFVCFEQCLNRLEVTITDDGPGFDWLPYMEIDPSRTMKGNGRGIAKASMLFDEVVYLGAGNQVKVISYSKYPANSP